MPSDTKPPATQAPAAPPPAPAARRLLAGFTREVLLPAAVLVGLLAIAVALIEGPALQQFLYAVF